MREWLSWWSTTLPRSGSRVRVPSRALAMKIAYAAVAQSVERRIGSAEVTGPIPVSSFEEARIYGLFGWCIFFVPPIWQGQKDSNPRHAVLETAALPTELYP